MSPTQIIQKLWNYCNVLRDDGMSYGDYVEQLTYLLFLKMADERTTLPLSITPHMKARPITDYVITSHARYELSRRGLSEDTIRAILAAPEQQVELRP